MFSAEEIEHGGSMLEEEEDEEVLIDPLTGEELVAHEYDVLTATDMAVRPLPLCFLVYSPV